MNGGCTYHTNYSIVYTTSTGRGRALQKDGARWATGQIVSGVPTAPPESKFYRLFVFELSTSTFRGAEAEVVPVELELNVGHIEYRAWRLRRR